MSKGKTDCMKGILKFKPALLEGPLTFPKVVTTATCPDGTTKRDCVSSRKPVKDKTISKVVVPPGPVGVTFLKDVDINFFLLNQSYLKKLIIALISYSINIFF